MCSHAKSGDNGQKESMFPGSTTEKDHKFTRPCLCVRIGHLHLGIYLSENCPEAVRAFSKRFGVVEQSCCKILQIRILWLAPFNMLRRPVKLSLLTVAADSVRSEGREKWGTPGYLSAFFNRGRCVYVCPRDHRFSLQIL